MVNNRTNRHYSNVEAVDIIHQVANLYISTKAPQDYGTGEEYTSVEVHTLKRIADKPGITLTELAKDYAKTKGAISQIVKKIEAKGLIYREPAPGHDNKYYLYITEKGSALDAAHRAYDQVNSGEAMNQVRELVSKEDFNAAFRVLEIWLDVRREVQQQRLERKKEQKRARMKAKKNIKEVESP